MSAFNASGASLSVVSNAISKFNQLVQESYEKLSKTKEKLSYKDFYDVLRREPLAEESSVLKAIRADPKTQSDVNSMRITLATELLSLVKSIGKVKSLEESLNKEQKKGVNRIIAGLSVLYVVVIISLLLGAYVGAKPYLLSGKLMKGVQIVCVFAIILTIVSVLLNLLLLNSRYQLKDINTAKQAIDSRFKTFDDFLFSDPKPIPDFKPLVSLMIVIYDIKQEPTKAATYQRKFINKQSSADQDKLKKFLALSYEQQVAGLWDNQMLNIVINIHREGEGASRLAVIEKKTDAVQILQGTNDILGNYYKLMLKSYQSPEANLSNEAILRILDTTVIKELKRIDLSDDKSYSNEEVIDKLNQSTYYSLIKAGFKHVLIYMYLPWKVVDYKKLMMSAFPNELSKSFTETVTDDDMKHITTFVSNDAVAKDITDRYPLFRANYIDELRMIETYSNSITTEKQKQAFDAFIAFSVSKFNNIYDNNTTTYFESIINATTATKQKLLEHYVSTFNSYFDKLYGDLIDLDLMKLNPDKGQFFIFDTHHMREVVEDIINSSNVLKQTEPAYRFYMVDAMINIIVAEQKKRFVTKYYDYSAEGTNPNTIKSQYITKKVNDVSKKLANAIAPYQISTANYTKYIYMKVFEGNKLNPFLTSLVDNVLLQVDFEASLIRKMKPALQDDDDTRYVLAQNFVSSINSFKFSTFTQILRVDDLKEIVDSLDFDDTGMFLEKEKSIAKSKLLLTGAIIVCIFGYVVYMTLTHSRFPDGSDFKDIDPVKSFQKLDNDQLKSYNTVVVREILISGVPLAMIVLFISIFASFLSKKQTDLKFNKERITQNTKTIKDKIIELKNLITDIDARIPDPSNKILPIKDLPAFTDDDKIKLYNVMKSILGNYDKCNYIIGISKRDLPFPYAEVFADGLMVGVIICVIFYIIFKFAPIERLMELKELYEYKETAETLVNDPTFIKEISTKFDCHTDNVESVMLTVKLLFATSIIVFMFLYTIRVVNSTNLYKVGLYNSKYFERSKCVN
jgi:hypothetical protein